MRLKRPVLLAIAMSFSTPVLATATPLISVDLQSSHGMEGAPFSGVDPIAAAASPVFAASNVWNVLGSSGFNVPNPSYSNLVDSNGSPTGAAFSIVGLISAYGFGNPADALLTDYFYWNSPFATSSSIDWSITGLTPSRPHILFVNGAHDHPFSMLVDENADGNLGNDPINVVSSPAGAGVLYNVMTDATGKITGRGTAISDEANWAGFQVFEILDTPVCGDVNDNGTVTSNDALLVLRRAVGQPLTLDCSDYDAQFSDCEGSLAATTASLSTCNGNLATTNADLGTCDGELVTCDGELATCDSELVTCDDDLVACDDALADAAIFLGETVITSTVGGSGGIDYVRSCLPGEVAIGIDGTVGTFAAPSIGNAQLVCAPFTNDKFGTGIGAESLLPATGDGGGGSAFSLRCPATMVMTGVTGSTKNAVGDFIPVVENLTIQCRGGGDPVDIGPVHGAADTIPFSLICDGDGIVTGIEGTADQALDSLALQCR